MEVYDTDWFNKVEQDAIKSDNRASRYKYDQHAMQKHREDKLTILAAKQTSKSVQTTSPSSNLMILHDDALLRILKADKITRDSLAFITRLKATNRRLCCLIRNEMHENIEYSKQVRTIPFLIAGTNIPCNAKHVQPTTVVSGTIELIDHFNLTCKMGPNHITVSDVYTLDYNECLCMTTDDENVFFISVCIYIRNNQFLQDIPLVTTTTYDISGIPNVMRQSLDFPNRTHNTDFIDLVMEEFVYYYRMVRCWPHTTMLEIYDAIAHAEGWNKGTYKLCLKTKGPRRAGDTLANVRQLCLGEISVSLFTIWPNINEHDSDSDEHDSASDEHDSASEQEDSDNDQQQYSYSDLEDSDSDLEDSDGQQEDNDGQQMQQTGDSDNDMNSTA